MNGLLGIKRSVRCWKALICCNAYAEGCSWPLGILYDSLFSVGRSGCFTLSLTVNKLQSCTNLVSHSDVQFP